MPKRARRIVLYSHDTVGLGHMRRNLLLAQTLAGARDRPSVLLVFGSGEACAWRLPPGVESLTLPAVRKLPSGSYAARNLDLPFGALIALRRRILTAALEAFDPDLVIVDKVPAGLGGELLPAIESMARRGKARLVLGLRDILDDPAQVETEWSKAGSYELVRRRYEAVWVYGDRRISNPALEYGFDSAIAAKVYHTGYLDPLARAESPEPDRPLDLPNGPLALCMVGGGQDGGSLVEAFSLATMPAGTTGVILAGPQLPTEAFERAQAKARTRTDLRLLRFVTNPLPLIRRATHVVSMGGYNTVSEIVRLERHALIVPRVSPRTEQLIRAERLSALGLVDVLHPVRLSPETLSAWLATSAAPSARSGGLDFGGLVRVRLLSRALLAESRPRRWHRPSHQPLLQQVS